MSENVGTINTESREDLYSKVEYVIFECPVYFRVPEETKKKMMEHVEEQKKLYAERRKEFPDDPWWEEQEWWKSASADYQRLV